MTRPYYINMNWMELYDLMFSVWDLNWIITSINYFCDGPNRQMLRNRHQTISTYSYCTPSSMNCITHHVDWSERNGSGNNSSCSLLSNVMLCINNILYTTNTNDIKLCERGNYLVDTASQSVSINDWNFFRIPINYIKYSLRFSHIIMLLCYGWSL